jgi:DNA repair exonuclease SbcCD ATPase subunit
MRFKSIRWRNLFSYGNKWTEFDLDSNLAVNIIGKNGDGKSVLVEAIYLALTGKPLRKCLKSTVVNIYNKKDCMVELVVEAGNTHLMIARGVKPNIFNIYKDGSHKPMDESSMMVDTQTYLETVLGFTTNNLKHTLIMSTTDYKPFLTLPAADKRLFIEDILSIEIFTIMNKLVKAKLSILKDEIRDNITDIEKLQFKLNMIIEYNRQQQENDDDEINQLKADIETEITSLAADVESINHRAGAEIKNELKTLGIDVDTADEKTKATIAAEKDKLQGEMAELKIKAKECKVTLAELKDKNRHLAVMVFETHKEIDELKEEKSVKATSLQINQLKFEGDTAKYNTGVRSGDAAELKIKLKLDAEQKDLDYYTDTDECTECGQEIDPKFKDEQLDAISCAITALKIKSAKVQSEIKKVENFKRRINKFNADSIIPLDDRVKELSSRISDLEFSEHTDLNAIKMLDEKETGCRTQMNTFKVSRNKIQTDTAARIAGYNTETVIKDMKEKSKTRTDRIHTETADRIAKCNTDTRRRIAGHNTKIDTLLEKERGNIKDEAIPGRDVEEAETKKKALTFKKLVYDATIRILSDKGIKTYIIKRYLPKLNKLVNDYLEILSAPYKLSFNEELEEIIALKGYDKLSYENFSMGERQRCDVALLFAYLDIGKMKNSISSNLLIMDEVLDRSLDDDGIIGIINIIDSMKTKGYTVVNISHKHQLADKFDITYRAEKQRFSRLFEI